MRGVRKKEKKELLPNDSRILRLFLFSAEISLSGFATANQSASGRANWRGFFSGNSLVTAQHSGRNHPYSGRTLAGNPAAASCIQMKAE